MQLKMKTQTQSQSWSQTQYGGNMLSDVPDQEDRNIAAQTLEPHHPTVQES